MRQKHYIDKVIYVFAIIVPLMTIPQALKIWMNADAKGVSILAWATYFIASFFWIIYGRVHNKHAIILTHSLMLACNGLVVIGAIIYR